MRRKERNNKDRIYTIFKLCVIACIGILMVGNVIVFAKSVKLSDHIQELEKNTAELKAENAELKRTVYDENSLSNLAELADQLGFTKKAEPIYLETPDFALVR